MKKGCAICHRTKNAGGFCMEGGIIYCERCFRNNKTCRHDNVAYNVKGPYCRDCRVRLETDASNYREKRRVDFVKEDR